MIVWVISLSVILTVSLSTNALLFLNLKKARKAPAPTLEVKELMADLARDKFGMVAFTRVNTDDILLRSPRNR